jgi:hypothetical protein
MEETEHPPGQTGTDSADKAAGQKLSPTCLNCGTVLQDVFCHHCGQKNIPQRQTLGELLTNFISSFWSYEGKFFRTIRYLITKPGFLSTEYNAGRRESYYHPARMYVFISFVFFLVFAYTVSPAPETETQTELSRQQIEQLKKAFANPGIDSLLNQLPVNPTDTSERILKNHTLDSLTRLYPKRAVGVGAVSFSGDFDYASVAAYDSAEMKKPASERDGWLERKINIRMMELNKKYQGRWQSFGDDLTQLLFDNISKIIFVLLPVFALLLKLLYVRRDFYYSEHLVFSIYYYNFVYFAGSLQLLVGHLTGSELLSSVIGLWIVVYLLFAMKRAYLQNWWKTIAKYLIFSFLFLVCICLAFFVALVWIVMFM